MEAVAEYIAGEYDDAELGVGAWLKGESVYLVDGVADCAEVGTGGEPCQSLSISENAL